MATNAKQIDLEPLTGFFDARSSADAVPFGVWRYLQNCEMKEPRKLRRSPGWEKLLTRVGYNNQDLHDQLTSLTSGSTRQPLTMLYQAVSTSGLSKLFAATSKRIFALNNSTGNWRIISDALGSGSGTSCGDHGWSGAQVDNTIVFTNGLDQPVYHVLDQPANTEDQSVEVINDLVKLRITQAKVVASFKGLIVIGNVVMEGERISHRLIWSDASRPLSWVPKQGESAAGYQDLGYGEDIVGILQLADSLLVYTTSGIWEGILVGGDSPLVFRKRYSDHTAGNRCLAYPRTLISTGSDHYYLGRDGIYRYNFYTDHPIREDWMHLASSVIFSDIDAASCNAHCAGYNASDKSIYFSWVANGEQCPGKTLVLNTEYLSDYVLDHGFSSFVNYNPDSIETFRDWIIENCVCTQEQMNDVGLGFTKEGQYCTTPVTEECTPVEYLYTHVLRTVDDITIEDWDQVVAHPNSLCAKIGNFTLNELCAGELNQDECNAEQLFVGASSQDFCLKQIGTAFSRERCTNVSACGEYAYDGYKSIMRSGPMDLKMSATAKMLRRLLVDVEADDAAVPSDLALRIGASYQPADPNSDRCSLRWFDQSSKKLKCPSIAGSDHTLARTRQALGTEWALYIQDRYFVVELSIDGLGGAASFSKLTLWVDEGKK